MINWIFRKTTVYLFFHNDCKCFAKKLFQIDCDKISSKSNVSDLRCPIKIISYFSSVCSNQLHKEPHQLLLLTWQIHRLTAFSCDLLTSCWSLFSAQWPAAISLVLAPLKSTRVLDNTRELYVSPESSATKKKLLPPNNISACLQRGATWGEGVTYRRRLWMHGIWCVYVWVQRLCGLRAVWRLHKKTVTTHQTCLWTQRMNVSFRHTKPNSTVCVIPTHK